MVFCDKTGGLFYDISDHLCDKSVSYDKNGWDYDKTIFITYDKGGKCDRSSLNRR